MVTVTPLATTLLSPTLMPLSLVRKVPCIVSVASPTVDKDTVVVAYQQADPL